MKQKFTDPDQFAFLRMNAITYMNAGFPECDSAMIPIVIMLNACESIAVRWCCESHPIDDGEKDHFYIAMAVRDQEGLDYIHEIYEKTIDIMNDKGADHFLEFSMGFLYMDEKTLWRRWIIDAYTTPSDKDIYLESFYKACKTIMDKFGYKDAR